MTDQDPTGAQDAGEHQGSTTTGEVVEDAQPKAAEPPPPDTQSTPTETEPTPTESEPAPTSPVLEHLSDTIESAKHAADEALSPQRD